MQSLLKLHKQNRKTSVDLKSKFLLNNISEHNYSNLLTLVDDERFFIENEMYDYIEKEDHSTSHFRKITGMISVLYAIGLSIFIHNWIVY